MSLLLYNTLTRRKEVFRPREPGKVGLYVCGITPYEKSHVGHARCYVAFDVIFRWLRRTYDVVYVRNFTDIDDKIIARAAAAGEDPLAWANRFIAAFHEDMDRLKVLRPQIEPRVTEHIPQIVSYIEEILARGHAYRVPSESTVPGAGDDVFFRVRSCPIYGDLSGRRLDDLLSGARVDVDPRKEDPLDFALWKSAKPDEPAWPSPFGLGRPGWHIECSVMSTHYLGRPIDIHGGGKDLVFPHHTNEIAQGYAVDPETPFCSHWLHNGFVNVESVVAAHPAPAESDETLRRLDDGRLIKVEKMSKSLGNFFTVDEVLGSYTPEALRWCLVVTHYRSPITYGPRHLEEAERRLHYLYGTIDRGRRFVQRHPPRPGESLAAVFADDEGPYEPWKAFESAMNDDVHTPKAVAALLELLKRLNLMLSGRERERIGRKLKAADRSRLIREGLDLLARMAAILGVGEGDPGEFLERQRRLRCALRGIDPAAVDALLDERRRARQDRDFQRADEIRDRLLAMGVEVQDTPEGATWSVSWEEQS